MSYAAYAVREFHKAFGLPQADKPTDVPIEQVDLRIKLLAEETHEVAVSAIEGDVVNLAKELADVVYVAYGTALTYGIDLDSVFLAVHLSNMSKLGKNGEPILRDDGKVLKSELYRPPDVARVLRNQ